jgi:uncharacterized RDD family membrane protein YckC
VSEPSEPSPYAPPASMLRDPPLALSELLASRGQRFVNLIVDGIALMVIGALVGIVSPSQSLIRAIVVSTLVEFAYHALLEGFFGRTLGKLVTGTQVVASDGSRASWGRIIGRTLARSIPFEPLSFFGRAPPVGWHDSLSNTRVIRVR